MEKIDLVIKLAKKRAIMISAIGYVLCAMCAVLKDLQADEFNSLYYFVFGFVIQIIILNRHRKYSIMLFNVYNIQEHEMLRIDDNKLDIAKKSILVAVIIALVISNMNPFAVIFGTYGYLWLDNSKLTFAIANNEITDKLPKKFKKMNMYSELRVYTMHFYSDLILHISLIIVTSFILKDIFSLHGYRLRKEISEASFSLSSIIVVIMIIYIIFNIISRKNLASNKESYVNKIMNK